MKAPGGKSGSGSRRGSFNVDASEGGGTEVSTLVILYKKPKIQINFLRVLIFALIFGLFNFFDERSLAKSLKDPTLFYFIISITLTFLSIKSIKKDISIIGSSNRIR